MSINAFERQNVYYHTLEGNCDSYMYVSYMYVVGTTRRTIFLVFFETGRNVPLQLKQTVTR